MKTKTSNAQFYSSNLELQKEHFIRRKGENPLDKVWRCGQWVDIAEHNAKVRGSARNSR